MVVTQCHVKGNYYNNNTIGVSEKKILEKYVVEKYENTEIEGTCYRSNTNVQHSHMQ